MKYDTIGKKYSAARKADPRIVSKLVDLFGLPANSTIADIGAGTGNYSTGLAERGYNILAIEPSAVMREQAKFHKSVKWIPGSVEELPLEDASLDGAMCIFSVHHFANIELGVKEIFRALKPGGRLIFFSCDHQLIPADFWLKEYLGDLVNNPNNAFPTVAELKKLTERVFNRPATIVMFPLPPDMEDRSIFTGWQHPEWYLEEVFIHGASRLAALPKETIAAYQAKLRQDLESGIWQKKHGDLLAKDNYFLGHFFLVV